LIEREDGEWTGHAGGWGGELVKEIRMMSWLCGEDRPTRGRPENLHSSITVLFFLGKV
jgi:hypothetical protein